MKAANGALVVGLMLYARGVLADDPPECDGLEPVPSECFPNVMCQEFEPYWDYRRAVVRLEGPDMEATGVLVKIQGKHAVHLVPRFHADEGSHIIVEVSP